MAEALHLFMSENNDIVNSASARPSFNGLVAMDDVRCALQRMLVTQATRQTGVRSFFAAVTREQPTDDNPHPTQGW